MDNKQLVVNWSRYKLGKCRLFISWCHRPRPLLTWSVGLLRESPRQSESAQSLQVLQKRIIIIKQWFIVRRITHNYTKSFKVYTFWKGWLSLLRVLLNTPTLSTLKLWGTWSSDSILGSSTYVVTLITIHFVARG